MNEGCLIAILYDSIRENGFSARSIELIDNFIDDILNGPLIGAYAVCCYARASFEPSANAPESQGRVLY